MGLHKELLSPQSTYDDLPRSMDLLWNLLRWGSHGRRVFLSQSPTITESQTLRQWKSKALPYLIPNVQPLDRIMTSLLLERSAVAIRKAFLQHIALCDQRGIRISARNHIPWPPCWGCQDRTYAVRTQYARIHHKSKDRFVQSCKELGDFFVRSHTTVYSFHLHTSLNLWPEECPFSRALPDPLTLLPSMADHSMPRSMAT